MKYISLIILTFSLVACTEFFEPDVSGVRLTLLSPTDSLYTASADITFWWEPNDSAEAYRLQLFSPSVDQFELFFDTTFSEELITLNIVPGAYEWRVRIENPATSSAYQGGRFTIDQFPPEIPFLHYPLPQDTLEVARDSLVLRWESQDTPINGQRRPVIDSVYLRQVVDSTVRQTFRFEVGKEMPTRIDLSSILTPTGTGPSSTYTWQIISIDPVGNKRGSNIQSFVIRP